MAYLQNYQAKNPESPHFCSYLARIFKEISTLKFPLIVLGASCQSFHTHMSAHVDLGRFGLLELLNLSGPGNHFIRDDGPCPNS